MESLLAGKIVENKSKLKKRINYKVSLFNNKIKKTFTSSKSAYEYANKKMHELLNIQESNLAVIKYTKSDKRVKYWTFEKQRINKIYEVIATEYSEYDFIDIYKAFFPKNWNISLINERGYSFHDVARKNALVPKWTFYFNLIINTIFFMFLITFVLFGIDMFFSIPKSYKIESNQKWISIISTIVFLITSSLLAYFSIIFTWRPFRYWNNLSLNDLYVDWRKEWWIRKNMKVISTFIIVITLSAYTMYFINTFSKDFYENNFHISSVKVHFICLIGMFSTFCSIGIVSFINTISILIWKKNKLNKYFSPKEIKEYNEWISYKSKNVVYKKNIYFFELPFEENEKNVNKKRQIKFEIEKNSTKGEILLQKQKLIKQNKYAIEKYLEKFKGDK